MLHEHEIIALFNSQKVHCAIKARMVRNMQDQNPTMNRNNIAWKFNTTERIISEYLQIAQAMKHFPALDKIPTKTEALILINSTNDNTELRQLINVTALKYKSQLLLKEIKYATRRIHSDVNDSES